MAYDDEEILKGITYNFKDGLIYGLIGKNGAGKTTLLKTMCRLIQENTGKIFIDDECVDNIDYLSLPISFINDEGIFYNNLTVNEHLLLICSTKGIKKSLAFSKIEKLMDMLKLTKYKNYFPEMLSKGTLQRFILMD